MTFYFVTKLAAMRIIISLDLMYNQSRMTENTLELVLKAKKGDKEAFGEVYKLFFKRIFRFVHYLVREHEVSQDVTQTTFIKAWKSLPSFSTKKGTFQSFLFTIARNLVIDHQRKKKNISLEVVGEIMMDDDLEGKMVKDEEKKMVHRTLDGLESEEKHIIALRFFEDLSFKEVADIVGEKEGAIRVRTHRILKKLKEVIEKEK